ncbi:hypothetical protein RYX36_025633 [Vicia faba]
MVNLNLRVLSRPDTAKLPVIVQNLGLEYDEEVLPSIGNEVLKSVVANYKEKSPPTTRWNKVPHCLYLSSICLQCLPSILRDQFISCGKSRGVAHELVSRIWLAVLDNLEEFSRAVEQKQVAQQEAERSKFVVMKAEQERRAAVIRAEGESDAAILISEATAAAGMGLVEFRRIEASREVAGTLEKSPNVTYLPGGNNMMMALNPAG